MGPPEIHNKPMARLFAGTSGFAYAQWKPQFYPAKLPANKFLEHYAQRLELGGDQLHVPPYARRRDAGELGGRHAAGIRFRLEGAHAYHAHHAAEERGGGHELFSCAPSIRCARRGGWGRFCFSFRRRCAATWTCCGRSSKRCPPTCVTPSNSGTLRGWWTKYTGCWRARNISLCVAESEKLEVPEVITADFVYYRLRKPDYTAEDVDAIAGRAQGLLAQGKDLFLMFKHEETPDGALHAEEVLRKVAG